jgi:hypothetical protein
MFVRFRQTPNRLQVSLVETRRVDGKIRHEHIASLGSVSMPPEVADRIAFWQRLHERLARLANRVDAAKQGKILGDIHARIPMVTMDEQRALRLENAEANERFWTSMQSMQEETATDHKKLAATAESAAASMTDGASVAAANVMAAKDHVERIKRGEDVPVSKPPTREDAEGILRKAGWTAADVRFCLWLNDFHRTVGEEGWKLFEQELRRNRSHAVERRAARAVLKKMRVSNAHTLFFKTGDPAP